MAQMVKNPPAMPETWVRSLGWEDPLEKGKATQLQYSGLENSMDYTAHGVTKSVLEHKSVKKETTLPAKGSGLLPHLDLSLVG